MAPNTQRLIALNDILGKEYVKNETTILSDYSIDGVMPWAVVFPENTQQVSEVVCLARKENLALVPWGSGSKMTKGNTPSRMDIVICTKRLNKIVDMDTANLTVTVQAGGKFKDIQAALASQKNRCYQPFESSMQISDQKVCSELENKGCFIPMWPPHSQTATMGGIIAANSNGPTRLLYGLPRDMLLGVQYVSPSGEIIGMGGKTVKNVSSFDICKLMIGSMGTLGILCEMTFRLLPLPERKGTFLSIFGSLAEASVFVEKILKTSLLPAAIELLNSKACELLVLDGAELFKNNPYVVAVAMEGFEEAVECMSSEIRQMASESGTRKNIFLQKDPQSLLWGAYSNLPATASELYPHTVSTKLNYPISRYAEIIELVESLTSDKAVEYALLTHAGSGITTIHFLIKEDNEKTADDIVMIIKKLLNYCQEIVGNLVIEKAPYKLKPRLPIWGVQTQDLKVMKWIKQQIDPLGLFCPGRFVGDI